jgi:hypothetical protein
MNIFYVDHNPVVAAQSLCDKHVVKMVLESAQLLSTAQHLCSYRLELRLDTELLYKPTHKNHPCAKWVRECAPNYNWLVGHALALCEEYTYRYGKVHKSQAVIANCRNDPALPKNFNMMTPPALAMPDVFKTDDPVESYRNYYRFDKLRNIQCTWTKRERPGWL